MQIDFQAAVVFDAFSGKQTSYNHLYFIQNNIVGDDTNNELNTPSYSNPCLAVTCQNFGTCSIGINNMAVCLCAYGYDGIAKSFLLLKVE